uniref:Uncharacterized protein n=1 Tax=Arion vulgaris TaxID=1028688 RepID=A0A0B7ASL8_9EUPU
MDSHTHPGRPRFCLMTSHFYLTRTKISKKKKLAALTSTARWWVKNQSEGHRNNDSLPS